MSDLGQTGGIGKGFPCVAMSDLSQAGDTGKDSLRVTASN
jgi:hypothetical protein